MLWVLNCSRHAGRMLVSGSPRPECSLAGRLGGIGGQTRWLLGRRGLGGGSVLRFYYVGR
jgi:hypothetical protein